MTKEALQNQATGLVFHLKHQHQEWRVTVSTTLINQISKAITSMPQFKKWFKILNKKSKRKEWLYFLKVVDKKGRVTDLIIDAKTAKVRQAKRGGPLKKKKG